MRDLPPDPVRDASFPTIGQLRRGILLNCIARSFWLVAHEPAFEMECDGDTYFGANGEGEHWAVSFPEGGAVAVFFSSESSRNPFPDGRPPYDQSWYFRGMPGHLEPARDRALSHMYNLDNQCRSPAGAVITAAMWAIGEQFTAVEPWKDVFDHSLWVLRDYLLPPEEALREWWQGTDMPDLIRRAAWAIYERRVASAAPVIPLEQWEWEMFVEAAGGDQGKVESVEHLLGDLGITLEPHIDG
ncbi:hypothetical protein [Zavarzinella formosa]|uniref:hypothetical protein n=1 Tax=Zavarzinella formosa TaxID=360055 RepID=UPI0002EDCA7A|nr:hypothetical protein [Zavarzinella formosa]